MRSHPIVRTGLLALVLFAAPLLQPRPVPAASAGPGVTVTTFATDPGSKGVVIARLVRALKSWSADGGVLGSKVG